MLCESISEIRKTTYELCLIHTYTGLAKPEQMLVSINSQPF